MLSCYPRLLNLIVKNLWYKIWFKKQTNKQTNNIVDQNLEGAGVRAWSLLRPLCASRPDILDWTLDSESKGSGFDSRQCPALLSFSKALYSHCCSPPRCINGYPVGCEHYCGWVGIVCACKTVTGRNAPQGVEEVHSECRIVPESYDRGNNTLWSALIIIWKSAL